MWRNNFQRLIDFLEISAPKPAIKIPSRQRANLLPPSTVPAGPFWCKTCSRENFPLMRWNQLHHNFDMVGQAIVEKWWWRTPLSLLCAADVSICCSRRWGSGCELHQFRFSKRTLKNFVFDVCYECPWLFWSYTHNRGELLQDLWLLTTMKRQSFPRQANDFTNSWNLGVQVWQYDGILSRWVHEQ